MEARLQRTEVHLHLALRDGLEGDDGASLARQVREAAESFEVADRLAQQLHGRREVGGSWLSDGRAPRHAITRHLTETPLDPAEDQAALFLALVLEGAVDDTRIPKQVLVYEATRLRLGDLDDPVLQVVARAARALTLARAGYCEAAREEAGAVLAAPPTLAAVEASAERWLSHADAIDVDAVHSDLRRALSVAAGATRACCAIRDDDRRGAAGAVEEFVLPAQELGVAPARLSILRSWAALARGEPAEAREHLAAVDPSTLDAMERPRYSMVRDALSSRREEALDDAAAQLVDRRWLSGLALRGIRHAFWEDGLLEAIGKSPTGRELLWFASGHAAITEAARARYPLLGQTHEADRSPIERLSELFR